MMKSMFLIAALCLAIATSARANDDCTNACLVDAGYCTGSAISANGVCQAAAWADYEQALWQCTNLGPPDQQICVDNAGATYDDDLQACNDEEVIDLAVCSVQYTACVEACN